MEAKVQLRSKRMSDIPAAVGREKHLRHKVNSKLTSLNYLAARGDFLVVRQEKRVIIYAHVDAVT